MTVYKDDKAYLCEDCKYPNENKKTKINGKTKKRPIRNFQ